MGADTCVPLGTPTLLQPPLQPSLQPSARGSALLLPVPGAAPGGSPRCGQETCPGQPWLPSGRLFRKTLWKSVKSKPFSRLAIALCIPKKRRLREFGQTSSRWEWQRTTEGRLDSLEEAVKSGRKRVLSFGWGIFCSPENTINSEWVCRKGDKSRGRGVRPSPPLSVEYLRFSTQPRREQSRAAPTGAAPSSLPPPPALPPLPRTSPGSLRLRSRCRAPGDSVQTEGKRGC